MKKIKIVTLFLLCLVVVSCGPKEEKSEGIIREGFGKAVEEAVKEPVDFSGTWQRETDSFVSTITIDQSAEVVKFNWGQEAKDGSFIIECNDQGECDKVLDGKVFEHYSFSFQLSEDKQRLLVNWIVKRIEIDEIQAFVDEIRMMEGGQEIVSKPIIFDDEGNVSYGEEEYRFIKVED
jgi:hypothetical protein